MNDVKHPDSTSSQEVRISKLLAYVLRHDPQSLGIRLDAAGWAVVDELLDALARQGEGVKREELEAVVQGNSKRRFAFNEDRTKIRASQGHSIPVELGLVPQIPPSVLYHGTASRFIESIRTRGLQTK